MPPRIDRKVIQIQKSTTGNKLDVIKDVIPKSESDAYDSIINYLFHVIRVFNGSFNQIQTFVSQVFELDEKEAQEKTVALLTLMNFFFESKLSKGELNTFDKICDFEDD